MPQALELRLTVAQRRSLEQLAIKPKTNALFVRRIHVILCSADGVSAAEIAERFQLAQSQVSRIRRRYLEGGMEGLAPQPKAGRKDHAIAAAVVEQVVQMALSPPPPGRIRWTSRLLARALKIAPSSVSKILREKKLKPHLVRTYKVSRDPDFVSKVRDVVGLYLNPPQKAIVLSVDEKTSIQALERTQLPLPLRTGRASRHTHDYKRHGVVDLYAALEVATGQVTHRSTDSHTAKDFLSFLKNVAKRYPRKRLCVVLDNSSTHKTAAVQAWLRKNPRITFHYTPTSASWLNQVEGLFGILGKQSLSQTHFPSKQALRDHLDAFFANWNQDPTPFVWTKPADAIIKSQKRMIESISRAVH